MAGSKHPILGKTTAGKKPVEAPNSVLARPLRFRFNLVDVDGPWCLTKVKPSDHKDLLNKLKQFEGMTVGEVFSGTPGKDYDSVTNDEANKRLLELFNSTEVSRLRVGGQGRLYGIRENEYFSILWWDPRHEIYPAEKK